MPTILKDRIIFSEKDWLSGMHSQYQNTSAGSAKITNGLSFANTFNPYIYWGYACPGEDAQSVTNADEIDGVIKRITAKDSTNAYMVGGTSVYHFNPATETISNSSPWSHAITPHNSGPVASDCILYNAKSSGTSAQYLFYSWNDTGDADGDIGRYDLSTTFDDDFISIVPAGASVLGTKNEHPMIVGADDILYIGDGEDLWAYDGQTGDDGTLTKNPVALPKGMVIEGFALFQPNTLAIFCSSRSRIDFAGTAGAKGFVFFWDYLNADPFQVFDLDNGRLGSPFVYRNTIGCFQTGNSDDFGQASRRVKIKVFNGQEFKIVAPILTGGVPSIGGVENFGELIIFNLNGVIYSWGNTLGQDTGLNIRALPNGTTSGAFQNIGGVRWSSSGTGATNGLQKFNGKHDTGGVATAYAIPNFSPNFKGKIDSIEIVYGKTSTGGRDIDLQFRDLSNNLYTIFENKKDITSGNLIQKYYKDSSGDELPQFTGLKAILAWGSGTDNTDAPIVDKIIVHYSQIKYND